MITAYPDIRVAAGAATEAITSGEAEQVALPVDRVSEGLFAVRAAGHSMDGGKRPIRDGDWLVMRLARSAPLSQVEGRVALVEIPDEDAVYMMWFLRQRFDGKVGGIKRSLLERNLRDNVGDLVGSLRTEIETAYRASR